VTREIVIHADAQIELEEAAIWYEERRLGLGVEFMNAIDQTLGRIAANPAAFPLWRNELRKAVVRRFTFAVFYEVTELQIRVYAFAHTRRRPGYWLSRKR